MCRGEEAVVKPSVIGAWSVLAVACAGFLYIVLTWPDVDALAEKNPTSTAFIDAYRQEMKAQGRDVEVKWRWVPYQQIALDLKQAVVVAEDLDFFAHQGFDVDEIEAAIEKARNKGGKLRGASTLTQQLAKNLWLSPSRNPLRKVKEAILTVQLERRLDKRRILELYLNVAEFGPGIYGAEAASRAYFGRPAAALDRREAASLAASLSRPRSWHPGVTSRGYQKRIQTILYRIEKAEWLWQFF